MTKNEFLKAITRSGEDILKIVFGLLRRAKAPYCVIGGLAVNAYAEPVVSLDLDLVVVTGGMDKFIELASEKFKIERFPYSINLTAEKSDLRIQVQTDPRYQDFIERAVKKNVLGEKMMVACLEDVLKGKLWAWSDEKRRMSKRQKDLADIYRLVETYPELQKRLPGSLRIK